MDTEQALRRLMVAVQLVLKEADASRTLGADSPGLAPSINDLQVQYDLIESELGGPCRTM